MDELPAPRNVRPYTPQGERRPTQRTKAQNHTQLWRAVGWYGASGALYGWDEKACRYEGSNYKIVWVLAEEEALSADGVGLSVPAAPAAETANPRVMALAQRLMDLQQQLGTTLTREQQGELVGIAVGLGLAAAQHPDGES
ncbi:hypothetical protein C9F11_38350 [Streptomyces sp. YIM 121038]|uniref:hypothetical protein n=1 Tax=Streptomyces sp. YIM 121038 TaxID=2136401 RepID=UPI0011648407|nr:hypothetical protein [Streptomyces sp. YIM 121038]QCX81253.1 hypothetical protein C9F11_38350 [Streptomyces sp. YIM 121038]